MQFIARPVASYSKFPMRVSNGIVSLRLLVAHSKHAQCADECPLLGQSGQRPTAAYQSRFMSTRPSYAVPGNDAAVCCPRHLWDPRMGQKVVTSKPRISRRDWLLRWDIEGRLWEKPGNANLGLRNRKIGGRRCYG